MPASAGLLGVLRGPGAFGAVEPWPVDLDSHVRYLSGLLLALGLMFLATVPAIEQRTTLFRALAALVFTGGLARLSSLLATGTPSWPHIAGLCLELVGMPLLVLWQSRAA